MYNFLKITEKVGLTKVEYENRGNISWLVYSGALRFIAAAIDNVLTAAIMINSCHAQT